MVEQYRPDRARTGLARGGSGTLHRSCPRTACPARPRLEPGYRPAGRDAANGVTGKTYSRTDPQNQLRVLTERLGSLGFPFGPQLSRAEQNLAGELRGVRDYLGASWIVQPRRRIPGARHHGAPPPRGRCGHPGRSGQSLRLDVQRAAYENETRRTARTYSTTPDTADDELPAWRERRPPAHRCTGGHLRSHRSSRPTSIGWRSVPRRSRPSTSIRSSSSVEPTSPAAFVICSSDLPDASAVTPMPTPSSTCRSLRRRQDPLHARGVALVLRTSARRPTSGDSGSLGEWIDPDRPDAGGLPSWATRSRPGSRTPSLTAQWCVRCGASSLAARWTDAYATIAESDQTGTNPGATFVTC